MSLARFPRRIRERAEQIERGVNKIVKKVAIAAGTNATLATPVDTGRARANWQAGVGRDPKGQVNSTDKGGAATIGSIRSRVNSRQAEQPVYISNNVEYIGFLNRGSSAQAPAGFVELAVRNAVAQVRGTRIFK